MPVIKHRNYIPSILALGVLVAIIGCGGGGGGTSSTGLTASATGTSATGTSATGTTATATATTSTATTSTAGTTGLTDGGISGVLVPNSIYYSEGLTTLRNIKPDGTGDNLVGSLPANFGTAIPNPLVTGQWIFTYSAVTGGNLGIYKNSSLSISGAVPIVSPVYSDVTSLQMSPDGSTIYYVGLLPSATDAQLLKVSSAGGTPLALDTAESAHLNMKGDRLVYSKFMSTGGVAQIFWRSTADSATPSQLTSDTKDHFVPQWNRAGEHIVFSATVAPASRDLYTMKNDGTSVVQVTNTPGVDELGGTFNTDGSLLAVTVINPDATKTGIYTVSALTSGATPTLLKADSSVTEQIYWTGTNGRAIGGSSYAMIRSARRKH